MSPVDDNNVHHKCIVAIEPNKRQILRAIRNFENSPWTVLFNGFTVSENAHVCLIMSDNKKRQSKYKRCRSGNHGDSNTEGASTE
jgi:hypothetical protein